MILRFNKKMIQLCKPISLQPQINHGKFPREALDLFEDSEMQKMLSQDYENFIKFDDVD